MEKKPPILAISGVKNSGKTTLICALLKIFSEKGLRVAVIKHDGHDFDADVPGTDTYRQLQAGAVGTVIFSPEKSMIVKKKHGQRAEDFMGLFPEADLILLEGFKDSGYPKLELVRAGNSYRSVCDPSKLLAIVTDLPEGELARTDRRIPLLPLDEPEKVAAFILRELLSSGKA